MNLFLDIPTSLRYFVIYNKGLLELIIWNKKMIPNLFTENIRTNSYLMKRAVKKAIVIFFTKHLVALSGLDGTGKSEIGRYLKDLFDSNSKFVEIDMSLNEFPFSWKIGSIFPNDEKSSNQPVVLFFDKLHLAHAKMASYLSRSIEKIEDSNIMVIVSSSRPLESLIAEQIISNSLYYNLHQFEIRIPSLQERGNNEKIFLANHFLERICLRENLGKKIFSDDVLHKIFNYGWPGNVTELKSTVEKSAIESASRIIPIKIFWGQESLK